MRARATGERLAYAIVKENAAFCPEIPMQAPPSRVHGAQALRACPRMPAQPLFRNERRAGDSRIANPSRQQVSQLLPESLQTLASPFLSRCLSRACVPSVGTGAAQGRMQRYTQQVLAVADYRRGRGNDGGIRAGNHILVLVRIRHDGKKMLHRIDACTFLVI